MEKKAALVIANGDLPNLDLLTSYHQKSSLLLCTDGAANQLANIITPDVIIGDLDSLTDEILFPENTKIIHEPCQYSSDLEKAFNYLLNDDFKKVYITGVNGGRLDHITANLSILKKYADRLEFEIFDDHSRSFMLTTTKVSSVELKTLKGQIISLVPLAKASGIMTKGLEYHLNDESLEIGIREGLSNFAIEDNVEISIKSGCLLIYQYSDS